MAGRSRSEDSDFSERERQRKGKRPRLDSPPPKSPPTESENNSDAQSKLWDPLEACNHILNRCTPDEAKKLLKRVTEFVLVLEIGEKIKHDIELERQRAARNAEEDAQLKAFCIERRRQAELQLVGLREAPIDGLPSDNDDEEERPEPEPEPEADEHDPFHVNEEIDRLVQADLDLEIEEEDWLDFRMGDVDDVGSSGDNYDADVPGDDEDEDSNKHSEDADEDEDDDEDSDSQSSN